jgi:hypothetical protein
MIRHCEEGAMTRSSRNHNIEALSNSSKMWQSLNIFGGQQQIKIRFTKKLKAEQILGILAVNQNRIFSSPIKTIRYTKI